jgi:YesN/AraC family two-component response regulator
LEALCLGVHDYIAYPFQRAEIESVIKQALGAVSVFA